MTNKTWLAASCAVMLMAAGPAFAQSQPDNSGAAGMPSNGGAMNQPSDTQPNNGSMNNPSATGANSGAMNNEPGMQPNENTANGMPMNRHARHMARHERNHESQAAEVERLNEQSLQAAQQGKTLDVTRSGATVPGSNGMGNQGTDTSGAGSSGNMAPGMNNTGGGTMGGPGTVAQPGNGKM